MPPLNLPSDGQPTTTPLIVPTSRTTSTSNSDPDPYSPSRSDGDDLLEVHFPPSGTHRRKSSMQAAQVPSVRRPSVGGSGSWVRRKGIKGRGKEKKVQILPVEPHEEASCIVHQMLAAQHGGDEGSGGEEEEDVDADADEEDNEDVYSDDDVFYPSSDGDDENDNDTRHTNLWEPPVLILPDSCGTDSGQADEKAWLGAMRQPRAELPHLGTPKSKSPPTTQPAYKRQNKHDIEIPSTVVSSGAEAPAPLSAPATTSSSHPPKTKTKTKHKHHHHHHNHHHNHHHSKPPSSDTLSLPSRQLTKTQLTAMVWHVRELSRRLGSIRIKARVRSIFLLTKIHDAALIEHTRRLVHWLLHPDRGTRYVVYVEGKLAENRRFDVVGLRRDVAELQREAGNGEAAREVEEVEHGRLRMWTEELCREKPETFDFCITLGGDGTVLYAGWLFQRVVPPVLTFSLGSLGFLTKFDFGKFEETLTDAFAEGVVVSLRLRFECTVMRTRARRAKQCQTISFAGQTEVREVSLSPCSSSDPSSPDEQAIEDETEQLRKHDLIDELIGSLRHSPTHTPTGTFSILNELVIDRGPNPNMSSIEIFGDDEHFTSVLADGLCVSTPTGSTAYNLAAGGSLCHPDNPVMLVTSICAHALSFRPILLPDTIVLRVGVPYDARTSSWASFDGRERVELKPGDYVTVSASRYPFASVVGEGRSGSGDWVNSIRKKLGWNTRQRQKAFEEWSGK